MQIINNGTIKANKDFGDKQIEIIKGRLYDFGTEVSIVDANEIDFDNHYNTELSCDLVDLCGLLLKDGYTLNGRIEYYGDYEGVIFVKDNVVYNLDIQDAWRLDATDKEIIDVLESRGYIVMLKGKPAW